jgi:hypothetical protein
VTTPETQRKIIVKCKQLVEDEDLCDPDDRQDFALGKDGVYEYESFPNTNKVSTALDLFHEHNAIGCLDDYEIWAEDEQGNKLEEEETP